MLLLKTQFFRCNFNDSRPETMFVSSNDRVLSAIRSYTVCVRIYSRVTFRYMYYSAESARENRNFSHLFSLKALCLQKNPERFVRSSQH